MPIQTLHRLAELDPTEWDALLADSQPFLCHAFLSALEDSGSVGGRSGWQPAHRLLRDPQGGLRAALPLYRKSHSYGEYVFDWAWADACQRAGIRYYPKLLCAVPFTPVAGQRLLGDVEAAATLFDGLTEQLDAQQISGIHVNFTESKADRLMAGREGWLERIGCQFHWHNRGYRDFQDFLDALTSRKRKQLRKEREQVAGRASSSTGAKAISSARRNGISSTRAMPIPIRCAGRHRTSPAPSSVCWPSACRRRFGWCWPSRVRARWRWLSACVTTEGYTAVTGAAWRSLTVCTSRPVLPGHRPGHRGRPAALRCRRAGRAQADPGLRTGDHALLALPAAPRFASRGDGFSAAGARRCAGLCRGGAAGAAVPAGRQLATCVRRGTRRCFPRGYPACAAIRCAAGVLATR